MITDSVAPGTLHSWAIYMRATEEARRRGDRRTGTDHLLLALLEDSSIEDVLDVSLPQARHTLDALDHAALTTLGLGLGSGTDAPPLPMRGVPEKPRIRDIAHKDRFRMAPVAKKVLEEASRSNPRKLQVTAHQVLDQVLALQPPDPAGVLLGALGVDAAEVLRRLNAVKPES